jgi:GT2 family glycosyltransferase
MINIGFPCFKNKKYIEAILPSMKKFDDGLIGKVIVVDQGSNDGTVEFIKAFNWDKVILIENKENKGCWEGRNRALEKAWEIGGEYLIVCDSDIEIRAAGWLKNMKEVLDKDARVGVVEGLVQVHDGSWGFAGTALCMVRMKMMREIGYFDPSFKLGGDRDFWCRIEMHHWDTAFCSGTDVFHKCGGTTTDVFGTERDRIIKENYDRLFKKYNPDFVRNTYGALCEKRSAANKMMAKEKGVKVTIVRGAVVQRGE